MQDIIINLLLDLFYNADYHTQVFLCFAVFLTGLWSALAFSSWLTTVMAVLADCFGDWWDWLCLAVFPMCQHRERM